MSLNESISQQERAKLAVWDYPVSDKFTNMWRVMKESVLPETSGTAIERVLTSNQNDDAAESLLGIRIRSKSRIRSWEQTGSGC